MSLLDLILSRAAPVPSPEEFGTFLFVGPHPDDIEIGAGATAAKLAAAGKKITFLICTDGRYGDSHTDLKGDDLVLRRKEEAVASAKMLGVTDVRFLPYLDGVGYGLDELRRSVAEVIAEVQPEVLFCPDPDVDSECHPDHLNVGRICKDLAFCASHAGLMGGMGLPAAPLKAVAFYMTARPNRYVITSPALLKLQLDSIFLCHETQFPEGTADRKQIPLYLKLRSRLFGLRRLRAAAEGFRVLGRTQMHCMPEAGR